MSYDNLVSKTQAIDELKPYRIYKDVGLTIIAGMIKDFENDTFV